MSLRHPDQEEGVDTGEAGSGARGCEATGGSEKGEEQQEGRTEDMEVAIVKKQPAEMDSDTLIAAVEVTGGKQRTVEVEVRLNTQLFADANSDILLEAVEISLGRKKKSEMVFFKDSN